MPWFVLFVIVLVRLALGLQFQSVGSLGPAIMGSLGIDYVGLGILLGLVQLPGAVLSLPAGWLNARLGDRKLALGGLTLMTVGATIIAVAGGLDVALAGRLLTGVGSTMLGIVLMKLVFDQFSGPALPVAIGFLMAAWPAGQALGLAALPPLAAAYGWRWAMASTAAFCAIGFVALAVILPRTSERKAPQLTRLMPGELAPLLAAAVVWAMFNAALNIFVGYGPAYFVATGQTALQAGALVGLLTLPLVPLVPLGGYLSRFFPNPRATVPILLGIAAGLAFAVPSSPWPGAMLFGLGLIMGFPTAVMAAMPGTTVSAESRAIGLGISATILGVATTALPPLAGWVRDFSGVEAAALYVGAACFVVCVIVQAILAGMQSSVRAPA